MSACVHMDCECAALMGGVGRLARGHVFGATEGADSTKSWPFKERDRRVYEGSGIR